MKTSKKGDGTFSVYPFTWHEMRELSLREQSTLSSHWGSASTRGLWLDRQDLNDGAYAVMPGSFAHVALDFAR